MLAILLMATLLGVLSFGCGMLPLSFALSRDFLNRLTMVGTGLLLGTALGVIIPEGLEALIEANPKAGIPSSRIALPLLFGFTFMFLVEQFTSGPSHGSHYELPTTNLDNDSTVDFDAELDELESEQAISQSQQQQRKRSARSEDSLSSGGNPSQALPLTLGLVIHSLADGLALGVSFASGATSTLSAIVFLAIIIHKLPTSLALTTSLLATSLPRPDCKKHLAAFSVSTPVASVVTYSFIEFFGGKGNAEWTGTALLLSGGTFLYVATLVSQHSTSHAAGEMNKVRRVAFVILGMFIPFALSSLLGHGHESGPTIEGNRPLQA
ncbi:zinc transporter zip9-like [Moniliophthora roreri MCA 2997]|uniref:Zinc transporter zip9-like n=2 Tax=Moniliophthora roreri TaxID=221103 RepID=V2XPY7_MONRO|nr:zinc transporter zip9-like [Moniliophthora roreri MCA 2997]